MVTKCLVVPLSNDGYLNMGNIGNPSTDKQFT